MIATNVVRSLAGTELLKDKTCSRHILSGSTSQMRPLALAALACIGLSAVSTYPSDIRLIDRLDESMQRRFAAPLPDSLGMSRIMLPSSFGRHFQPRLISERDFQPA